MRPKPLAARLLAELACVARADADARLDRFDHADLTDRHRSPRTITADDVEESQRLSALASLLARRARRARWSGSVWGAFT